MGKGALVTRQGFRAINTWVWKRAKVYRIWSLIANATFVTGISTRSMPPWMRFETKWILLMRFQMPFPDQCLEMNWMRYDTNVMFILLFRTLYSSCNFALIGRTLERVGRT